MSGLTRDGTAEPLPRDQILRREPRQEKIVFRVQLTTRRIGNPTFSVDPHSAGSGILTYIYSVFYLTEKGCGS